MCRLIYWYQGYKRIRLKLRGSRFLNLILPTLILIIILLLLVDGYYAYSFYSRTNQIDLQEDKIEVHEDIMGEWRIILMVIFCFDIQKTKTACLLPSCNAINKQNPPRNCSNF